MGIVKQHFLVIAGCGPGSPDYVTPAVRTAVEWAEVLVGAKRLLDLFPGSAAEKIPAGADVNKVLQEIEARRDLKRIVVLVTGDPGVSSLARPILKRFGRETCRVIPGISSVQTAFARIGLEWQGARIIDAHGEDPPAEPETLKDEGKIAVLAGRGGALGWIGRLGDIVGKTHRIYACENLTLPGETVRRVDPKALASLDASALAVFLFIREDLLAETD